MKFVVYLFEYEDGFWLCFVFIVLYLYDVVEVVVDYIVWIFEEFIKVCGYFLIVFFGGLFVKVSFCWSEKLWKVVF